MVGPSTVWCEPESVRGGVGGGGPARRPARPEPSVEGEENSEMT